jgi:hypothetical protein
MQLMLAALRRCADWQGRVGNPDAPLALTALPGPNIHATPIATSCLEWLDFQNLA